MSRNSRGLRTVVSDWLLVATVVAALIVPSAMILLVPIIFLRGARPPPISGELTCLGLSAGWACMVIVQRGTGTSAGQLPYYAFLWLMPFLLAAFRPTEHTIRRFGHMLLTLFVLDLAFNLYALATGADLLGRSLDVREGVVAGRGGGIFAHSFYSGSISIAGLLTLLSRTRSRWLMLLPLVNLLLAGSWRFAAAILILWVFSLGWRNRSRLREALMVAIASILLMISIVATSGLVDLVVTENPSNAYRVYAWVTAIEKVVSSPLVGVGFPNEAAIQEAGVSFESLDENLIAESWYLSSAITFGIPYTLLYLGSLLIAFYGKAFARRNLARAILFPYVLVDLIYGSFFGSVLIYSWLWLLICSAQERSRGTAPPRARQAVLQLRAAPAVESAIHPHDAAAPHRG